MALAVHEIGRVALRYVRYPLTRSQGLVASLHRNSEPEGPALASTAATSWEGFPSTGHSDKVPVLIQNVPDKERYARPRTFYPGTAFLPGTRSVQLEKNPEANCLSLANQSALASRGRIALDKADVNMLSFPYGKTYDQTHHGSVRTTRQSSDRAYQGTLRVSIGHCGHSSPCLEGQGPPGRTNGEAQTVCLCSKRMRLLEHGPARIHDIQ